MRKFLVLVSLVLPASALANDGRNRYESMVPAQLFHLYAPVSDEAGFRVLPGDMEGGADGDPAFRWAQRHAVAMVRLATRRTVTLLGKSPYPLAIFDLSAENGDTPIEMGDKGPRGRHPGGSHDGGVNLDLGYYLTSEKGKVETPDPAACTEHYSDKQIDENRCLGPADRLDTDRQTLFLVEIVRLHRDRFDGELLENIGIDAVVRKAVLARAAEWARQKRFGVSPPLVAEMDRLFASSPYEGWARFHLHHVHVRLLPIDPGGRHARQIDALIAEDRRLEGELLARAGGEAAAGGLALGAELTSTNLERELDLRLLGDVGRARGVRFRSGGGEWQSPEDPLEPLHHVIDVERQTAAGHLLVEAEVELADGSRQLLRRTVALPRQPGFLRVKIDASRLVGRTRDAGAELEASLDFPPVYTTLITKIELVVRRHAGVIPGSASLRPPSGEAGQGPPERLPLTGPAWSARVKSADLELIEADVTLSGRVHLMVPVLVSPPNSSVVTSR